ncbi:integrase [Gossypium australe]|uniref:Integrase n=1 Tax=Gossypium australe TaxID=47621 RepID=A0A5B6VNP7_9ROSI|nr:integrase [Gossypium australe]
MLPTKELGTDGQTTRPYVWPCVYPCGQNKAISKPYFSPKFFLVPTLILPYIYQPIQDIKTKPTLTLYMIYHHMIVMDFVSGQPLSPSKKNPVWIVVDWLMKSTHFLPVNSTCSLEKLAELFMPR